MKIFQPVLILFCFFFAVAGFANNKERERNHELYTPEKFPYLIERIKSYPMTSLVIAAATVFAAHKGYQYYYRHPARHSQSTQSFQTYLQESEGFQQQEKTSKADTNQTANTEMLKTSLLATLAGSAMLAVILVPASFLVQPLSSLLLYILKSGLSAGASLTYSTLNGLTSVAGTVAAGTANLAATAVNGVWSLGGIATHGIHLGATKGMAIAGTAGLLLKDQLSYVATPAFDHAHAIGRFFRDTLWAFIRSILSHQASGGTGGFSGNQSQNETYFSNFHHQSGTRSNGF